MPTVFPIDFGTQRAAVSDRCWPLLHSKLTVIYYLHDAACGTSVYLFGVVSDWKIPYLPCLIPICLRDEYSIFPAEMQI